MEDILRQRFNYARITPYKNYSPITSRPVFRPKSELDLFFEGDEYESGFTRDDMGIYLKIPDDTAKYKRKFYVGDRGKEYRILNPPSPFKNNHVDLFSHEIKTDFHTKEDRHIKKHFNNPFSSIDLMTIERSIVRHGDKITFKSYRHTKSRGLNCKYFRNKSMSSSLTFNTVTGNFTTVTFKSYAKRKSKKFRTNSFSELETFLSINTRETSLSSPNETLNKQFCEVLDNKMFTETIISTLDLNCIPNDTHEIYVKFIDKFVKTRKIKVPNNYLRLLVNYYPTEKFFKKNDRKLISSITDMFGIKSNITNKILHEYPRTSVTGLIGVCQLFGDNYQKYIGNIKKSQFTIIQENGYPRQGDSMSKQELMEREKLVFTLTHKEKENMLGILNTHPQGVTSEYVRTMVDHLGMLFKLRKLIDIDFKSKTYTEFNREHSEFSKMISLIRKSHVNEFVFDEKMTNDVEKPIAITTNGDNPLDDTITVFHPVILRREEEYSEEGSYVHHCVGGYANSENSIIVSLRNYENGDRVTSEYDVKNGNCIQSKYYHNASPPEYYKSALKILQDKIDRHAMKNRLKSIDRKQVRTKINGVEVPLDFHENINQRELVYF